MFRSAVRQGKTEHCSAGFDDAKDIECLGMTGVRGYANRSFAPLRIRRCREIKSVGRFLFRDSD